MIRFSKSEPGAVCVDAHNRSRGSFLQGRGTNDCLGSGRDCSLQRSASRPHQLSQSANFSHSGIRAPIIPNHDSGRSISTMLRCLRLDCSLSSKARDSGHLRRAGDAENRPFWCQAVATAAAGKSAKRGIGRSCSSKTEGRSERSGLLKDRGLNCAEYIDSAR